jgi:hypothetical protein
MTGATAGSTAAERSLRESIPDSTRADRDEQLSARFQPLTCRRCGTEVRVRKSSPQQTSVQWQGEGTRRCPFLARPSPSDPPAERCPELSETIRAAVAAGLIPTGAAPAAEPQIPAGPQ